MLRPGDWRRRLAATLTVAHRAGLLSEHTFAHRLDVLFSSAVIEPRQLVGDLTLRAPRRSLTHTAIDAARRLTAVTAAPAELEGVLALDWSGVCEELLVGRHHACDIVLTDPTVSRRHARLRFRDGRWIVLDLGSTNGTRVNGHAVGRCRLEPGDRLALGDETLVVD